MKNKYNIIPVLILICVMFLGCNDDEFIDRSPIDFLAPDNFKTEKDIEQSVSGIYKAFISDREEPIKTEFIVDNGYYVGYQEMWKRIYNNETSFIEQKWSRNYSTILRANTVLFYIDNVPLSEEKYNQYKGEATFLRALAYFDLLEFYGAVPLRTEPESLSQKDKALSSENDILEFVLAELETASELLPISYGSSERGRATKGAALAIKARAYLYHNNYEMAIEYCQKVKGLGIYSLMDDFGSMFLPENEATNTETIFDLQFETNEAKRGLSNSWYTRFVFWGGYQILQNLEEQFYSTNGLSIDNPSNTLYDESINPDVYFPSTKVQQENLYDNRFSNRDPRLHATIVVPYSFYRYKINGVGNNDDKEIYYPSNQRAANFSSFKARKYVDYSNNWVHGISGANPIIIRFADILLMEAEAMVESGTYDEVYVNDLINQVRQRLSVMMPKVEDVEGLGLSQDAMRQIIRHERRVEFALEGLRYFDIKRWDIGSEAFENARGYEPILLKSNSATYEVYDFETRTFDLALGYLWPIPRTETDSNNLIQ